MNERYSVSLAEILGFFLSFSLLYLIWVAIVQPMPDRDSVHQLLYPLLNSLKATQFSLDPYFLKIFFIEAYPFGLAFLVSLVGLFGLQDLLFTYPWLLNLLPLFFLALAVSSLQGSFRKRLLMAVFLFLLPYTQISLHSLSFHGMISITLLSGYLLVRQGMIEDNRWLKITGVGILLFAASLKHLGLVHFINILLAYSLLHLSQGKRPGRQLPIAWGSLFLLLPFYPIHGFQVYLEVVFTHNPYLAIPVILGISLILILALLTLPRLLSSKDQKSLPELFGSGRVFLFCSCFAIWMAVYPVREISVELMWSIALTGYFFLFYQFRRYELEGVRAFDTLVFYLSFLNGAILYASLLGQVYANFFFPLMLAGFLFFWYGHSTLKLGLVLLACFFLSNFFPPPKMIERYFWHWGHIYYTRGMNGLQQNLLGWQHCELGQVRDQLTEILDHLDFELFGEHIPIVFRGFHYHTRLQLIYPYHFIHNFPMMIEVQDMGPDFWRPVYNLFVRKAELSFEQVAALGKFPILIDGRRPLTSFPVFEREFLAQMQIDENDYEAFGTAYNDVFFNYLKKNLLLPKYYRKLVLPLGGHMVDIYIHNSLQSTQSEKVLKQRERDAKIQYELYQGLSILERWSSSFQAESERADLYHHKGSKLMDQGKPFEAWIEMQKGLKVVPDHPEILQDIILLQRQLQTELELKGMKKPGPDKGAKE